APILTVPCTVLEATLPPRPAGRRHAAPRLTPKPWNSSIVHDGCKYGTPYNCAKWPEFPSAVGASWPGGADPGGAFPPGPWLGRARLPRPSARRMDLSARRGELRRHDEPAGIAAGAAGRALDPEDPGRTGAARDPRPANPQDRVRHRGRRHDR